jgi:hypothetical protein
MGTVLERMKRMRAERGNPVRGVFMALAACVAFWRGWQIHTGHTAWLAYGLGVAALGLAAWHFTRRRPRPRV